jgi:HSP20 family protein
MMTMYMTPYRRAALHRYVQGDQIARNISNVHCDVHIPLDIIEESEAYLIHATLPGLKAEDVEIEIVNDTLILRGEFKQDENEDVQYLRRERPAGTFHRALRFGTKLEAGNAEAKLENGILTLRVPKVAEALPKTIQVKTK